MSGLFIDAQTVKNGGINIKNNKTALKEFREAFSKWESSKPDNYYMKVNFSAFSPVSGIWEIHVENGRVIKWVINDRENPDNVKETASKMTMEYFFDEAKKSYNNKKNDLFASIAEYDKEKGFVKMLAMVRNPQSKGNAPTDRTYRYEITELKIED
jgi:hypothetical protein